MAKIRGVDTYVVDWNIYASVGFKNAYDANVTDDLHPEGPGCLDPVVAAYTRQSIAQTLVEYPDLTGEFCAGCARSVEQAALACAPSLVVFTDRPPPTPPPTVDTITIDTTRPTYSCAHARTRKLPPLPTLPPPPPLLLLLLLPPPPPCKARPSFSHFHIRVRCALVIDRCWCVTGRRHAKHGPCHSSLLDRKDGLSCVSRRDSKPHERSSSYLPSCVCRGQRSQQRPRR